MRALHLRHPGISALRGARTYSSSGMGSASSSRISVVEVERKFLPSMRFQSILEQTSIGEAFHVSAAGEYGTESSATIPNPTLSLIRLPDRLIRDTYYDLNEQLDKRGIWVRQRNSRIISNINPTSTASRELGTKWEAKVRLAGDYTNSQFHEIEGESEIRSMLAQYLPRTRLHDLTVMADLETHRKTWAVHERGRPGLGEAKAGRFQACEIHVVLDEVEKPCETVGESKAFRHLVGEVEMTKELRIEEGWGRATKRFAAKKMDGLIEGFVGRHSCFFLTSPKRKGKLSAYFEWKEGKSRSADSAPAREDP